MKLIRPNTIAEGVQPFTRAGTATYIDRNGVLQTAAVNEPRFQGGVLLVEGSATNRVRNSMAVGAGVGSPGVLPNNWNSAISTGLSRAVVATGTEMGVSYVDVRFFGTNTSGASGICSVLFDGAAAAVPAVQGQVWTPSVYLKVVGGSLAGLSQAAIAFYEKTAAMGFVRTAYGATALVTSSLERFSRPADVQGALTAFVDSPQIFFSMAAGASIDVTLRIGLPQFESGAVASSVIPTTTTTASRAADVPAGSGLLATTATEAHPTYNSGTAYAVAARVVSGVSIYESLTAANTGNPPATSPTHWARLGPSNAWALLDAEVSTQTSATGVLSLALAPGIFDTLAVIGVDAEAVTLTVQDGAGGPIVYQQAQSVTGADVYDWYEYFFSDPTVRRTLAVFSGVPPYASAVATLTVAGGGTVKVGGVVLGRVQAIGDTQYGAQAGITDYSRKDTDEFGTTTFVRRAMSKKLTAQVQVSSLDVNRVHRLLSDLRATPVLWIGTDAPEFSEPMVVFGFYRDFYLSIAYPTVGLYQLEIEGLS